MYIPRPLKIDHRPDGIYIVCHRGDVCKMIAGYSSTQMADAEAIINIVNTYVHNKETVS